MNKRIFAALSAAVVSAFLLAGCTDIANSISAQAQITPVDLNNSAAVDALCDTSAQEALNFVTTAAKAKENSGQRNMLTNWGLTSAEAQDATKLEEVQAALLTRAETPCEELSDGDRVGVENTDGSVTNLPLVAGTDATLVIDTTTQVDTPPVLQPALLDGSLRFTAQTLSWSGLVERVGDQQWFIDGINARAVHTGFTWDDILRFAEVNKVVDGKIQGTNALAIQIFNRPDLTDEQAREMVREYVTPELEVVIGLSVDELPIQRIDNGFVNTRNAGSSTHPRMGEYFDTQKMVRVSLMPIKFDETGKPVSLDGTRGAGMFIDCGNLHWVPQAVWHCPTDSCEKPPPPPVPVCPWNPNLPPESPDCLQPKGNRTPVNPGWTPLQAGPLTDGRESQRQQESGETRGNVVDDPVPSDTVSGSTTPDTIPSDQGGPVAPGATPGGDNRTDDVEDEDLVIVDDGGTSGGTCVVDPFTGENNC